MSKNDICSNRRCVIEVMVGADSRVGVIEGLTKVLNSLKEESFDVSESIFDADVNDEKEMVSFWFRLYNPKTFKNWTKFLNEKESIGK